MNREILFKAKRINWKELPEKEWWVEGIPFEIEYDEKYVMLIKDQENQIRPPYVSSCMSVAEIYAIEIDPDTICQYTGLTDKNRKKIWENDILSAYLDDLNVNDITYAQVTWNGFSWCVREDKEGDVIAEWDCNTFEVCDNIFNNTELLKN